MPRRNPEDVDLAAIKTDLEFLIEGLTRLRKEQALKPLVMRPVSLVWARIVESEKPVFTMIFGRATAFATAISEAANIYRDSRCRRPMGGCVRERGMLMVELIKPFRTATRGSAG